MHLHEQSWLVEEVLGVYPVVAEEGKLRPAFRGGHRYVGEE